MAVKLTKDRDPEEWQRRWRLAGWAFCSGLSLAQVAEALDISGEHLRINMRRKGKTRPILMREFLQLMKVKPFSAEGNHDHQ